MKILVVVISVFLLFTFSFAEQIFKIHVDGMTCKLCPLAVKKSLKKVKGVKKVEVSFKKKLATVVAEDYVKPEQLLRAIERAGMYKGKILKIEKR